MAKEVVQQFQKDWKDRDCQGDADTIVLAHLGNYCTCRKIMQSWQV